MTVSLGPETIWKRRIADAVQDAAILIHRHIGYIFLLALIVMVQHEASLSNRVSRCLIAESRYRIVLLGMESAQRGYLITGDPEYKRRYIAQGARYSVQERQLEECLEDQASNHDRILEANVIAKKKVAEMDETIRLYESGDKEGAYQLVKSNEGMLYSLKIDELLDGIRLDTQLRAMGGW